MGIHSSLRNLSLNQGLVDTLTNDSQLTAIEPQNKHEYRSKVKPSVFIFVIILLGMLIMVSTMLLTKWV